MAPPRWIHSVLIQGASLLNTQCIRALIQGAFALNTPCILALIQGASTLNTRCIHVLIQGASAQNTPRLSALNTPRLRALIQGAFALNLPWRRSLRLRAEQTAATCCADSDSESVSTMSGKFALSPIAISNTFSPLYSPWEEQWVGYGSRYRLYPE